MRSLYPFLFVWLWSTGFIGAKYGLPYIEPYFMLSIRLAIAIGILLLLAKLFRERALEHSEKKGQMLVGTLLHGAYLGGVFFAIKNGMSAGVAAIIVGLQPLLTALLAKIGLGHSLQRRQMLGLGLGFVGTVLVIYGAGKLGTQAPPLSAYLAAIIALIGIASGSVLQKQAGATLPLLSGAAYQYMGAIVLVAMMSAFTESQQVRLTVELIAAMTWLVLGLSVAALLLLMVVIRAGEIAQVASYFYLVPPVTVLQAWWLFDEQLGLVALIGGLITVVGVYCVIAVPSKAASSS